MGANTAQDAQGGREGNEPALTQLQLPDIYIIRFYTTFTPLPDLYHEVIWPQ